MYFLLIILKAFILPSNNSKHIDNFLKFSSDHNIISIFFQVFFPPIGPFLFLSFILVDFLTCLGILGGLYLFRSKALKCCLEAHCVDENGRPGELSVGAVPFCWRTPESVFAG